MPTTQDDIKRWLDRAANKQATHLIVVTDTFDHTEYPVYVMPGEDAKAKADEENAQNMARVMEVYSLTGKHTVESQLQEMRAFHYD